MNVFLVGCCDNPMIAPPVDSAHTVRPASLKTESPPSVQVSTGTTYCKSPYAKCKVFLCCCRPPEHR